LAGFQIDENSQLSKELDAQKALASQVAEKQALENLLGKIDGLNAGCAEINRQLQGKRIITEDEINELDRLNREMLKAEASMQAGVMIGRITFAPEAADLFVTTDLNEPVKVVSGDTFKANGLIKLEGKNLIGLELKSGEMDFDRLRDQYRQHKDTLAQVLGDLGMPTIEAAKLERENQRQQNQELAKLQGQIKALLGDGTDEALRQKLASYGDLSQVKSLAELNADSKKLLDKKIVLMTEQGKLQGQVEQWIAAYGDIDGLLNKMVENRISLKQNQEQLNKLAPLPESFASADDFRAILGQVRRDLDQLQTLISQLKIDYAEAQRNLPELSFEELTRNLDAEETEFDKRLKHGKKLLKIRDAFNATREAMDQTSFTPVIDAFTRNLALITNGAYQVSDIDSDFQLALQKGQQIAMPINLLSSGTYDSVALSLRLAILENILADQKGFMILDDCLVDMDPTRQAKAVELIKAFSRNHQVIFTTCSPETAQLLGGTLIQL
jgi:exonuclease SbcC